MSVDPVNSVNSGEDWRYEGPIVVTLEPYNSVYHWLREHVSGNLGERCTSEGGLCNLHWQGTVGHDHDGLYLEQGDQRLDLSGIAHRVLRLSTNGLTIYKSRRF